jgi:DNA-binding NarL/FixJ family response regulator
MKRRHKIIIVDDHPLFREGLNLIVEKLKIGETIAEAGNGQELLNILETQQADVVLMDIDMPVMNGIEATEKAIAKFPDLKILIFSMYSDKKYYTLIIKAGAKGMVLKSAGKKEFETAIRIVADGGSHFSSEFVQKMVGADEKSDKQKQDEKVMKLNLTDREMDILKCLCCGFSAEETSKKLFISIKTVEHYRSKLLDKTGSKNTVSMVVFAVKNKLITL